MSTNTMYAKSLLLVRFRNRYWGTIYMNNVSGLLSNIYALSNSKIENILSYKISVVLKNKTCFIAG